MIRRLIILLLIVGCGTEPEDCAGVAGGMAYLDECGGCDANVNNDCIQDCAGAWGGDAVLSGCDNICNSTAVVDECGNCGGGEDCLVGSWKSTEVHMTYNSEGTIHLSNENEYYLYVFNSDGTGSFIQSGLSITSCAEDNLDCDNVEEVIFSSYPGIWMNNNNNKILFEYQNINNGNTIVTSWYFNLNENILILSNIENYEHGITNGMYLILEKE